MAVHARCDLLNVEGFALGTQRTGKLPERVTGVTLQRIAR